MTRLILASFLAIFLLIPQAARGSSDVAPQAATADRYRGGRPSHPVHPVHPVGPRWYPQPAPVYTPPYNYYWPTPVYYPYPYNPVIYPVFQWQYGPYGNYVCVFSPYFCWYR